MNVLVDTPVWSLAFRRQRQQLNPAENATVRKLEALIRSNHAPLVGAVRQELLSGMKDSTGFEKLRLLLRQIEGVPLTVEDSEDAARVANVCRAAGVSGSPVDYLLCAMARRRGWPVFTLDKDFARFEKLAGIVLLA